MGKHKKHKRKRNIEENNINTNSNNNLNNNLMEMLNNIDKEQISSLLSSLNLGNMNLDGNNGDEIDDNEVNSVNDNVSSISSDDKTLQILNAIKPMVNAERGEIIDRLIQLYAISRIIKK